MRNDNYLKLLLTLLVIVLAAHAIATWTGTPVQAQAQVRMYRVFPNDSGQVVKDMTTYKPIVGEVKGFWCTPDSRECYVLTQ